MCESKIKFSDRFLSVLLTVLMLISSFPMSAPVAMAATAKYPDAYTVTVKDGTNVVEAADVVLANDGAEWALNLSAKTDKDGVAAFDAAVIKKALNDAVLTEGKLTVTVSKTGYTQATQAAVVNEADLLKNLDVTLNKTPAKKHTVTVNTVGSAEVKLDGIVQNTVEVKKDGNVQLDVTAAEGFRIVSLTVNGVEKIQNNNQNSYSKNLNVKKDIVVNVTTVQQFTVTSNSSAGGNVKFKLGTSYIDVTNTKIDKNATIEAEIEAYKGYQIATVTVDGESVPIKGDKAPFTTSINVVKNTNVSVTFVKVYTVTVTFDSATGAVVTKPESVGGSVTVKNGDKVEITATPNANYRVSKVEVTPSNGNSKETFKDTFTDNRYVREHPYKKTITADKDYVVNITFSLKVYKVTVNQPKNGTVTVGKDVVEYNKTANITIKPNENYCIDRVLVGSTEYPKDKITGDEINGYTVVIENIVEDKNITVSFKKIEVGNIGMISWNSTSAKRVSKDGKTFIFAPKDIITFSAAKKNDYNIKVFYKNNDESLKSKITNGFQLNLDSNIFVEKIWLYEKNIVIPYAEVTLNYNIAYDKTASEITVTPDNPKSKYYNGSFNVNVKASENVTNEDYSGIAKIEYKVTSTKLDSELKFDNIPTEAITQTDSITYTEAPKEQNRTIPVDVTENKNNSDFVCVWVKVTDKAGNVSYSKTGNLIVNATAPKIKFSISGSPVETNSKIFGENRTATILFYDRASTFDIVAAKNSINITATDKAGKDLKEPTVQWAEQKNAEENVYKATIEFQDDAKYSWNIGTYTNKAGNTQITTEVGESVATFEFTVDKSAPTQLKINLDGNDWTTALSKLTFGLYKNNKVSASATGVDSTTDFTVKYYKTDKDAILSFDELEALYNDPATKAQFVTEPIEVNSDEKFVIYARFANEAGKVSYINTDGVIYDETQSIIKITLPKLNGNNAYTTNKVSINVNVTDDPNVATYSGIQKIEYEVKMGKSNGDSTEFVTTKTQELYSFNYVRDKGENSNGGVLKIKDWNSESQMNKKEITYKGAVPLYKDLKDSWNGTVDVISKYNNSDQVEFTVRVTDNAGNVTEASEQFAINIDKPTAAITFGDTPVHENVYNKERTATITLTDRNTAFDAVKATETIKFSAVDSENNAVDLKVGEDVIISDWKSTEKEPNKHKATVKFVKDGNYTIFFDGYTNKAGHVLSQNKDVTTEENENTYSFTVDKTAPIGTVTVNTNVWNKLLNVLTFGLFDSVEATITATSTDQITDTQIQYYKTSDTVQKTKLDLDNLPEGSWIGYKKPIKINANDKFAIYLKITDEANNYTYINSDGFVVDTTPSEIELKASKPNENGIYNIGDDVYVDITVNDNVAGNEKGSYSGIKTVEYWTEHDGITSDKKTLYSFDYVRDKGENSNGGKLTVVDWDSEKQENTAPVETTGAPKFEDLKAQWNGIVVVDKEKHNSSNTFLYVKTVDNAGKENTKKIQLDIDITRPTVKVEFDNNNALNTKYFNSTRTATIYITERANHFDNALAKNSIKLTQIADSKGKTIADAYTLSDFVPVNEVTKTDADTFKATLKFKKDANYKWNINYSDLGDNGQVATDVGESVAPFEFTVDTVKPFGTVKATSSEGRVEAWSNLIDNEDLTFGFWAKSFIDINTTTDDATSPKIYSVEYYKVSADDSTTALTKEDLDKVENWNAYKNFKLESDERFVLYIKIVDMAGWCTYISTDGLILDHEAPIAETIAPQISITPQQPINDIYNGDFNVDVKVIDPITGEAYSGIKNITYKVFNLNKKTIEKNIFTFTNKKPDFDELEQSIARTIRINSKDNNSNNVILKVYAEDNAGNTSLKSISLKIDVTKPTIDVNYNNNKADQKTFFKANRTATIVVTERNFNADDVVIKITNTDGILPIVSKWKKTAGTGNGDNTKWTAKIQYVADGDYTFKIGYKDLAGNTAAKTNYGKNVAPTKFTIDKTRPTFKVSYDNNSALNGNYYKASRVATIVVNEHNFDAKRVNFKLTATNDGKNSALPTIGKWVNVGDVHTAKVYFKNDSRYTIDIDILDRAGNASKAFNEQVFFVDKTAPKLEIKNIANNSANSGKVAPIVTYSDTNYDAKQVTVSLVGANNGKVTTKGAYADIHNGRTFTFRDFEKIKSVDDIYTLSVKLTDKAGNSTSKQVSFSVNRFGSTYALSKETNKLNGSYVKSVGDIIVTEVNTNILKNIKITLFKNNETIVLKEGKDYNIVQTGGNGSWYNYKYVISKNNFKDDGTYRLMFHTEDAAGNIAENTLDTKNTEVNFGVDKTNPTLVVTNLESKNTYALDSLKVKMNANDNLLLSKVEVYLDNYDKPYKTWSSKEISKILSTNSPFDFDISGDSTSSHKLKVVCTDAAGNTYTEEIKDFFVTTNMWVRYYTNKPLFFGSIAGVAVVVGLTIFIVVKKRKKDEE